MKAIVFIFVLLIPLSTSAEVIDRVCAFIDDEAITLGELDTEFANTIALNSGVTRETVLNTLINRKLLLREARALRIEANSAEETIGEYIDLKVRAFIKISERDIDEFYEANINEFKNTKPSDVREKIEAYLQEKEVNQRLKKHIEKLRKGSYVRIIHVP